jgi:hypothetical protein
VKASTDRVVDEAWSVFAMTRVRSSIAKVKFPEVCPVCLKEPEDLVLVTVLDRSSDDIIPDTYSSFKRGDDELGAAADSIKGAATFWIPTCNRHGSGSLRTGRVKFVAWASYFVFFYIILYFALDVSRAVHFSRPLLMPMTGLGLSLAAFIILVLYGYFPRILERKIKFISIDRSNDLVIIDIKNEEYLEQFKEMNVMHTDIL